MKDVKIKVWNEYHVIKFNENLKAYYYEIPTSSTPIAILSKDGIDFFISMLSGGATSALGLYNMECKIDDLQDTIDLFLREIKRADDIEVLENE